MMKKFHTLLVLPTILSATLSHAAEYFAAPTGSSTGDGSLSKPLSLSAALSSSSRVRAGDTLSLRGGTYKGKYLSYLAGASSARITVRSYPGEWARIDSGVSADRNNILQINGAWTTYRDFEVFSSDPKRISAYSGSAPSDIKRGESVHVKAPGTKLINLIVHDTASGLSLWSEAPDSEVYGCIVYNNGWEGTDRPHGHGIYSQNSTGMKTFKDNIVFNQFDKGIQIYGTSSAELRNFLVEGNTAFNAGLISLDRGASENMAVSGGSNGPDDITIQNNSFYGNELKGSLSIGGDKAKDLIFRDNYVSHLSRFKYWATATITGNTFVRDTSMIEFYTAVDATSLPYNWEKNSYFSQELKYSPFGYFKTGSSGKGLAFGGWQQTTRFDDASTYVKSRPTGSKAFVRPNQYQPGRGHITVFNWSRSSTVSVNVSGILSSGQSYEVRNAQNYFAAPVLTGTYNGSPLNLPMNGLTPATPVGLSTPPSTGPEFNVFVVQARGSVTATPPPATTVNSAPTISGISNRTITKNGTTGPIAFTIGDSTTSASNLGVVGSSSNPTLVPNANIKFGGSGSSRTVTVTPALDKTGITTITISVTDGSLISTRSFTVTVQSSSTSTSNTAPTISDISDKTAYVGKPSAPIPFTVSDSQTSASSLIVTGTPSNPTQVPPQSIVFGGSGSSRTVTLTPAAGQYGSTTITIKVSDGSLTDSTTFELIAK